MNENLILEELQKINEKLDRLAEDTEVTRDGVNALLEWAEEVSESITFPLPKIAKAN